MKQTIFTRIFSVIVVLFGLLFQFQNTFAQEKKSNDVKIEIEKLTLFKNGLGFIISNATLPENSKTVRIGQLPIPSFGTFWVGYPKDVKLQSLVTSIEEMEKKVPLLSIPQLLQVNTGRKVIIHTLDKDIEGTILSSPLNPEEQPTPNPYYMSPRLIQDPYRSYIPPVLMNDIISIQTEKGIVVLNPGSIIRVEFADDNPTNVTTSKTKYPSLRMELEKPAGGENVTVSFLAHGITWSPGYLIDLSDPKTSKFSAHAIIINELTDFNNVKLQLVTGFPNIKFSDINSPIAKSQSLAEFLSALSGSNQQTGNRYMMSQGMLGNSLAQVDDYETSIVPGYSTASEGLVAEDLFFYPVDNFTLKKDETAWIPLFTAEMPYKHIYTWKIGDFVDKDEHYNMQMGLQEGKNAEEVWHSCRIVNTLNMPLTTAATEFVTDNELTGQDVCYYTPPKGETTIRINKALNVLAEQTEIEVERTRDASTLHGYRYDLVKVRGELKLRNKFDKSIKVEISKELSGEVLESTPKSKDVKTAKGLRQVNEKHILTWEIELEAGSEQKISYQYQVYIRE
jgi:hypothetical protein